ncbi:integrase arm-type DNA-binding domain-containing protein [Paucibacter sp. O1-1]|nr:integrase arm-type DNA-binding domain-containing protein [Paucibacter sp. O1-1]MDA3829968.1 integrase arm-type DNA-binding domain-containing protein [Paucibacter sp. O1-1]
MARNLIPSDLTIRTIKPGDPRKRLGDGGSLYLLLFVRGGSHGWRLDYSVQGRRKTLSLGTYPDTGLSLARQKADEARRLVAQGLDPSEVRTEAKAEASRQREAELRGEAGLPAVGSFEAVAREWLDTVHQAKVTEGHAKRTQIRLEQDAFPWIGRRPIGEIEPPELLQCLRRVEARGAIETAHRIKHACGQVFRYGIAIGACRRNPAVDLKDALKPVQVSHHAVITEPKQVGKLMRDIDAYAGQPVTRAALRLSPLLLLRPGELRHTEWAWIDFEGATLTVPAVTMKRSKADKAAGPPHFVPLASQALHILRELHHITGAGRFVFPALTTRQRCMSDNTVRSALRRLGYSNDEMTAHGFRATARTMIAERLNVAAEIIEAQLAHAVPDALGRAYNRTQFLDQRRKMMQSWANYLDKIRNGADVLPLRMKNTA